MADTLLILHVKGTEAQTTELPKNIVRAAISQGQLTHSQLIWSPAENVWKQVREMPDLLPSQKLAPAPRLPAPQAVAASVQETNHHPVARAETPQVRVGSPSGAVPKVRVAAASSGATPQVRVAAVSAGAPQVRVAAASPGRQPVRAAAPASTSSGESLVVKEESHPLKWVCIALGLFIVLVVGGNYLLVDRPLTSSFAGTAYAGVKVYAHLGAFVQPNVLVIHIPNSTAITPGNITDFMAALSRSTPRSPITGDLFDRVALTSAWTAEYSFSGSSWKELGAQGNDSVDEQKGFVLAQMDDAAGESLVPASTLNPQAREAKRNQIWNGFVAHFAAGR